MPWPRADRHGITEDARAVHMLLSEALELYAGSDSCFPSRIRGPAREVANPCFRFDGEVTLLKFLPWPRTTVRLLYPQNSICCSEGV